MPKAKACVVFTVGLDRKVPSISEKLANEGYDVCTASAEQEVVEAAKAGSLDIPDAVKNCIDNAAICVFLIPQENSEGLSNAAGYAGRTGKKIVAVLENLNTLPQIFDDLASAVVGLGSSQLTKAIQGEQIWESPAGSSDGPRNIRRVRCQ